MTTPLSPRFKGICDQDLLEILKRLVAKSGHLEAELLAHIAEVDARKLYLREACSSMFVYCTQVLHFAESAAYHRISAARVARRYPPVLERLKGGELHLAGITLLAPHLTPENHRELLARAKHRSKRQIEQVVAELRPKPAAPAKVRKLPIPSGSRTQPERPELARANLAPLESPFPTSARRPRPVPLGAERFKIQFTATKETHNKLCEIQALLRHQIPNGDLSLIFDKALDLLLEDVKRKRFGRTARPQAARETKNPPSRHIPASIRRDVVQRDGGRCRYTSPTGQLCGSRDFLEFHHVEPWARARRHAASEMVLMCRAHNQLEGERIYGRAHMERCSSRNSLRGESI